MEHEADFSKIIFPTALTVTDQQINISSLAKNQKQFYFNLLKELIEIYQTKQKNRVVIGMVGPSGSGKSVTVAILKEMANQLNLPFGFETLGIDAFHYKNNFLSGCISGGEPLKNHKGRFDTYDVDILVEKLNHFLSDNEVKFPVYSRKTHEPVEDKIFIKKGDPVLLLVEGLWLLSGRYGWSEVGELLDFSIFVEVDSAKVRQGVVERHVNGGRTLEDAIKYYEANEAKNFDLVMESKERADKIVSAYCDIL